MNFRHKFSKHLTETNGPQQMVIDLHVRLTLKQIGDIFGGGDPKRGIKRLRRSFITSMENAGHTPGAKGTEHEKITDLPEAHRENARASLGAVKSQQDGKE